MLDTQSKTQLAVALDIIPFNNCHTLHCEKHVGCCRLNMPILKCVFNLSAVNQKPQTTSLSVALDIFLLPQLPTTVTEDFESRAF